VNNTGTYKVIGGQVIKVSDRIPILKKIPNWARMMNPMEEQRGVLNNMTPQQLRKEEATL